MNNSQRGFSGRNIQNIRGRYGDYNDDFENYEDYDDYDYDDFEEGGGEILENSYQQVKYVSNWRKHQDARAIVINSSPMGRQVKMKAREQRVAAGFADDDSSVPPLVQICLVCQKPAHSMCMFCLAPYCSKRCQNADWKSRHKNVCHNLAAQLQSDSDGEEFPVRRPFARNPSLENLPRDNLRLSQASRMMPKPVQGAGRANVQHHDSSEEGSMNNRSTTPKERSSHDFDGSRCNGPHNDRTQRDRPPRNVDTERIQRDELQRNRPQRDGQRCERPLRDEPRRIWQFDEPQRDGPQHDRPQHDGVIPFNSEKAPPFRRSDGGFNQSNSHQKTPQNKNRRADYRRKSALAPKNNAMVVPAGGDLSMVAPKKKPEARNNSDIPPFKLREQSNSPSQILVESTDGRPQIQVFDHDMEKPFTIMIVSAGVNAVFKCYTLVNNEQYEKLFQPLATACEAEEAVTNPEPGAIVCVFFEEAWYRAVYFPPEGYALVDMGQIIPTVDRVKNMPSQFKRMKEFACEIRLADASKVDKVQMETAYTCKLVGKTNKFVTADVYPYQSEEDPLESFEPSRALFQVKMRRWFLSIPENKPKQKMVEAVPEPIPASIAESISTSIADPISLSVKESISTSIADPISASVEEPISASIEESISKSVAGQSENKNDDTDMQKYTDTAVAAKPEEFVRWMEMPKSGGEVMVQLLHFSTNFEVFLRLADSTSVRAHDTGVFDVAVASLDAPPLSSPPKVGDAVIGKFQEEPYRAIVLSADTENDIYNVIYVDYGNEEFISMRDMSVLPTKFWPASKPPLVSKLPLKGHDNPQWHHRPRGPLDTYMKMLIIDNINLKCTVLENGEVTLKNTDSGESINTIADKHQQLQWKKQKANGESLHSSSYLTPKNISDCATVLSPDTPLRVVDTSHLFISYIDVRPLNYVPDSKLAERMREYCADEWSGPQYVPHDDELCFIEHNGVWKRAAVKEVLKRGNAKVGCLFVLLEDNYENVAVTFNKVRKAVEDFVEGYPRPFVTVKIKDFVPKDPTNECVERAASLLKAASVVKCDSVSMDDEDKTLLVIGLPTLINELKQSNLI